MDYKEAFEKAFALATSSDYKHSFIDESLSLLPNESENRNYLFNIPKGSGLYYAVFTEFVKLVKPKVIVELGNREGLGLIALHSGLTEPDQRIYTIDIVTDLRHVPENIHNDIRVSKLLGDVLSPEILQVIPDNIDVLFCDTIHTHDQLSKEWEKYQSKMNKKSVVFVDDIFIGDKKAAFDQIAVGSKVISHDLHASGFGIVFLNDNEETI
jgi:predicted O-methyltransferase YrrM